ncbi:hypothetical protein M2102_001680 [Fusobacterium sp. PH5-7]|nr:hypothetical protein [Fusobacterium sp. PH5-7]
MEILKSEEIIYRIPLDFLDIQKIKKIILLN